MYTGSREWEAVDPTLFPCSLLPLIKFVIGSLVPSFHTSPPPSSSSSSAKNTSDSTQQQLNKSELARQVVWACMIEDPRLFFRPLLNRFSKLYMSISSKKKKMEKRSMEHLLVCMFVVVFLNLFGCLSFCLFVCLYLFIFSVCLFVYLFEIVFNPL